MNKEQQSIRNAYYRLFNSDDGKLVLNDLKAYCHADTPTVRTQGQQPYDIFLCEGARTVFLRIQNLMRKDTQDE